MAGPGMRSWVEERKNFFFEKKQQKTFDYWAELLRKSSA
jgi:hypothetical protein